MKNSRYPEEQVAYALRLAESGTPVADVCRQTGIADLTLDKQIQKRPRSNSDPSGNGGNVS